MLAALRVSWEGDVPRPAQQELFPVPPPNCDSTSIARAIARVQGKADFKLQKGLEGTWNNQAQKWLIHVLLGGSLPNTRKSALPLVPEMLKPYERAMRGDQHEDATSPAAEAQQADDSEQEVEQDVKL